jgi:hypothetical protein
MRLAKRIYTGFTLHTYNNDIAEVETDEIMETSDV